MPSPFPGMDPYLEDPALWPEIHGGLIFEIRNRINRALRPKYVARVERRVIKEDEETVALEYRIPDIQVARARRDSPTRNSSSTLVLEPPLELQTLPDQRKQSSIKILNVRSGQVVTVLEILSVTNKLPGAFNRDSYVKKREEIGRSSIHLVEIDLLRSGNSIFPLGSDDDCYGVHVSRTAQRPRGQVWSVRLRNRLPVFPIPLHGDDPDYRIDLQDVLDEIYEQGAYDETIDYDRPPHPPLKPGDRTWAKKLIAAWRKRRKTS